MQNKKLSAPPNSPLTTDSLTTGPYKFARARARILEAAQYLATQKQAVQIAGIHPRTFHRWLKEGKDQYSVISSQAEANGQDPDYRLLTTAPLAAFYLAYEEASAQAAVEVLRSIKEASKDPRYWKAGMTLLERRFPEEWAKQQAAKLEKQKVEYTIISR